MRKEEMNVQEARFWLAYEARRLSNVECKEDIVKLYGRPMTEEEGKSWAKVTAAAIRKILHAAGLSDELPSNSMMPKGPDGPFERKLLDAEVV